MYERKIFASKTGGQFASVWGGQFNRHTHLKPYYVLKSSLMLCES